MSCVIFGTGPGLGSALAKKFASEGLHVALVARSKEFLESLSKEIQSSGGKATPFICDVSKEDSIKKCFKDMKSSLPPLKVLIYSFLKLI